MIEDGLNRVGILLTFTSGFLLSPQLIGISRIASFERWSERRLKGFGTTARQMSSAVLHYERLGPLTVFVCSTMLIVLAVILSTYLDDRFGHDRMVKFALPFAVGLVVVPWLTILLSLVLIRKVSEVVVRKLEGDDRLLSVFTTLGIVAFTTGNAFQFAATFHPKHVGLSVFH